MAPQLLSTKLFTPKLPDRYIMRNSPVRKMVEGYNAGNRLTLICAPAGFGKTTTAVEFLGKVAASSAWISLDDGDNDPGRFLTYLTAAVRKAGVPAGEEIDSLISGTGFDSTEAVLTLLINRVSEHGDAIILVFDDFHVIRSPKINSIMKFIMDHQPANLHMAIISREDPQLPLASLRVKGNLVEIRMADLSFSGSEASEFFSKAMDIDISAAAVERIASRTEGWAAGLQLAGLLLKSCGREQVDEFIGRFDGTNSYIIDYLVEEVLERQTPDIRSFLCKTSVLERMNAALCDELTGRDDSRDLLKGIEKANLFIIPLDDRREWYRYHHLFADSLRASLARGEERQLLGCAAAWMKKNGFTHEAVRYAFGSGDMTLAVKIVEDSTEEAFKSAQLESLVNWMDRIPDDLLRASEILSVRKAIAYFITGRAREAMEYVDALGADFQERTSPHNRGLLLTLKAMATVAAGQDAEPLAMEALTLLEPWDPIARTSTLNTLGRSQFRKGKKSEALETFRSAFESGMKLGYQFVTTLALMNYSSCLRVLGRPEEALALCVDFIGGMKERFGALPPYVGILYAAMAEICADLRRHGEADRYREEGHELCRLISYDAAASLKLYTRLESGEAPAIGSVPGVDSRREANKITLEYGETLSEREAEILKLICKGMSNQGIAKSLYITLNTAQWHISHIYSKLGVKSRTQAVLKAKELGL